MRKFESFMTGFASVFAGIGSCFVQFGEVIVGIFDKPSDETSEPPKKTGYYDGLWKDREALASDWQKIGGDFRRAIDQYVETHEGKTDSSN